CETAKRRETITYGQLAAALGLPLARQDWKTVLGPIAADEVQKTRHDLTLVVVYASGPAKGLGRYFSNIRGGQLPQSEALDPADQRQIADYKQALQKVYSAYANAIC
ncbi:MAG: hypothetical protein WA177_21055, partial [Xanthobacteraceae bacterium]